MKIWSGYGEEPPDSPCRDIEEEDDDVGDEKFSDVMEKNLIVKNPMCQVQRLILHKIG